MPEEMDHIKRANDIYEAVVSHIGSLYARRSDPEIVLAWIELIATFAWSHPNGRYNDGRIENIALEIGNQLDEVNITDSYLSQLSYDTDHNTILHVATAVYNVGGHSRVIYNWVQNDRAHKHSLVLVNQGTEQPPDWLSAAISETGGQIFAFSRASRLSRAKWLREIATTSAKIVILHHNPGDVVPVVAFAGQQLTPVAVFNHADHVFWLGATVADAVIDFREDGAEVSRNQRRAQQVLMLLMPLNDLEEPISKAEARTQLAIADDEVMLLSVGTNYKFEPNNTHNFFKTIANALERNPNAVAYIIGPTDSYGIQHERLHLLGKIEEPAAYYAAADIYVNGFPYGSGLALLEAARAGAYLMLAYAPPSPFMVLNDPAFEGILEAPQTEEEYLDKLSTMIGDRRERERIAVLVKQRVVDIHTGAGWRRYLTDVYEKLEHSSHQAISLPLDPPPADAAKLDAPRMPDGPLLLSFGRRYCPDFGLAQMARLLMISLKLGDTKLQGSDMNGWWLWSKEILYPVKQRLLG